MTEKEITGKLLDKLWYLQTQKCNYALFEKIFGKIAIHCWRRFAMDIEINFITMWKSCSTKERGRIIEYVNSVEFNTEYARDM